MQTVDFAIICALKEEARAVLERFRPLEMQEIAGWRCHFARLKNSKDDKTYSVAIIEIAEMGNLASLAAASTAIRELSPYQIFLVGMCGGFLQARSNFKKGDVVLAHKVIYYEPGKVHPTTTEARHREYLSATDWRKCVDGIARGRWTGLNSLPEPRPNDQEERLRPRAHWGTVASGEKVIAAQGFADKLRAQWPECISVEMEAAGVAYACQGTGTGFLVVKAVLDPADSSKNDDYRAFACGAAAAFVKSLLEDSELPALTQPSVMEVPLGDLFGLKRNSPTCIILPGYLNERHKECGVLNYPYNLYESAFDDVYSALRIVPAIEAYCGRKNVMFYFADETHPSSPPNTIFIGSSVVNAGTRHALANAYFRFGIEAQDHDIIDRNGTVRFSAKYIPVQGKRTLVMDYALMSAFDLHGERVVILAGCRAYGQIALGDMLSKPQFVRESLLREFAGDDFQCVVEVEVAGRTHRPGQIVASAVHGQKEDWRER